MCAGNNDVKFGNEKKNRQTVFVFHSSLSANTSTLNQRWNNVDRQRWYLVENESWADVLLSTLTKQRWNNVDRVTLIQYWWPNVVSTLVLGWKGKLSQHMFIGVEKTALKQLFLYWGSLESGSIIKQN